MFNYKITCDYGAICIIRARSRESAIKMYCNAERCTEEWFHKHCAMRKERVIDDTRNVHA